MQTEDNTKKLEVISPELTGSAWGYKFIKCYEGNDSQLPKSRFARVKKVTELYTAPCSAIEHVIQLILQELQYYYNPTSTKLEFNKQVLV